MTALFDFFKQRRRTRMSLEHTIHLERVKQSLRPHNTPDWYDLKLYLREWFFEFTLTQCRYRDAETLLNDIKARFPDCDYELSEFEAMIKANYELSQVTGEIVFQRQDMFAPYNLGRSFKEIEAAKALPAPDYLKPLLGSTVPFNQANS